jgi:hypothetical protein
MNNQIELKDNESLTWTLYESGSGILSLVFYAETQVHVHPVAAVFGISPEDVMPAIENMDKKHMWKGATYDPEVIDLFLVYEGVRPVAYTLISEYGELVAIREIDRMGKAARRAFNLDNVVE